MRVLVFSDTHGNLEGAFKITKKEPAELILHAGDLYEDALRLASMVKVPVCGVMGNCDFPGAGPESEMLTLEGQKILLIHGHRYRVKHSYQSLLYRAREDEVDAVVFGHTHFSLNETVDGILLFNPGSISRPLPGQRPGYGVLEINSEGITGECITL